MRAAIVSVLLSAAAASPAAWPSSVQPRASPPTPPGHVRFDELARSCAYGVNVRTLQAVVQTESNFNRYAIGVVGGSIAQPKNLAEARAAIAKLEAEGKNFSVGLGQVNRSNWKSYGLDVNTVLDPCSNLDAASQILYRCFAKFKGGDDQDRLARALSCYYSGNGRAGFVADIPSRVPYVMRVAASSEMLNPDQTVYYPELVRTSAPGVAVPPISSQAMAKATEKYGRSAKPTKSGKSKIGDASPKQIRPQRQPAESARGRKVAASWDVFSDF